MSGLKDPLVYRFRGVYGVYDDAGELMYVGSTTLGLKNLEENHRQARVKGYDMTKFGPGVQDLVWSTAVQYGPTAVSVFTKPFVFATLILSEYISIPL